MRTSLDRSSVQGGTQLFAASRTPREWRFASTRVLVFRGSRTVFAYGLALNLVIALLAGVTILAAAQTGGSAPLGSAAIEKYLTSLPIEKVPTNIAHASTCNRSLPDVSAALQTWITSLPNYSVAELGMNQCYHTEYPILIGAKTMVVFDGNGSTFASFTDGCDGTRVGPGHFVNCRYPSPVDAIGRTQPDWPQSRYHLGLLGNVKVIVANLHIDGGKSKPGYDADYAFQNGIQVLGREDGTVIAGVTIDHVWGDFVHVQAHYSSTTKQTTYPQNVTIENSHFGLDRPGMGAGRQGITIDDGGNVHVQNNVIQYSSRSAIDMEPVSSRALLKDIYIEHNTFGTHGDMLFADHSYGSANPVVDGVYFRYNVITGTGLYVDSVVPNLSGIVATNPATFRRKNFQFVGNQGDIVGRGGCPSTDYVMRFWGIDGLVVRDNYQPVAKGRCMVLLDAAKVANARITGNTTLNGIRTAARYYQSSNVCESGNKDGSPPKADTSGLAANCK